MQLARTQLILPPYTHTFDEFIFATVFILFLALVIRFSGILVRVKGACVDGVPANSFVGIFFSFFKGKGKRIRQLVGSEVHVRPLTPFNSVLAERKTRSSIQVLMNAFLSQKKEVELIRSVTAGPAAGTPIQCNAIHASACSPPSDRKESLIG